MDDVLYNKLREALRQTTPAPRSSGSVTRVALRPHVDARQVVDTVEVTREGGLTGDRWSQKKSTDMTRRFQASMMRADVAEICRGGIDYEIFGDNFFVDLDLKDIAPGDQLKVGSATFVVSEEVHGPCKKFLRRSSPEAQKLLAPENPEFPGSNLRGLFLTVVSPGRVATGDPISVLKKPD